MRSDRARQSAADERTTEVLITVEGHHATAGEDVDTALRDIAALLDHHQPGAVVRSAHLSAADPVFD